MAQFKPRQRKHKVLARQKDQGNHESPSNNGITASGHQSSGGTDTNQAVIIPPSAASKAEYDLRKSQMKAELRAQQSKMSSKKQKRLDKYIDTKLKKDETRDYLRRLEKEKEKFDVSSSAGLASSKDLNPKKRRFAEFVDGQVKHELQEKKVQHEATSMQYTAAQAEDNEDDDDDDVQSEDSFEADHQEAFDDNAAPDDDALWMTKRAPAVQGTGLAQPLQLDENGLPIIQMRRGKKRRRDVIEDNEDTIQEQQETEVPWDGFESEPEGQSNSDVESSNSGSDIGNEDIDGDSVSTTDEEELDSDDETSEEESASETSASEGDGLKTKIKPRVSAFKSWATQQLNQAVGHTPSYAADGDGELPEHPVKPKEIPVEPQPAPKLINGLPELKDASVDRKVYSVHVQRTEAIQESRNQLPILQREQEIMEAIHSNSVVVIKGDTGSGKTTQIPQFLYEAGYGDHNGPNPGLIGITQPRRVAAVSMAKRVAEELGSDGSKVSHQIRFDSTVSTNTAVKFMTDGILLRELSKDLLLKKYSAIIIDEAHERSVNTDILIGMLCKIVPARLQKSKFNPDPKPLKLIIMSATLNLADFLNDRLFAPGEKPPVVEAEGRQHRVTTHFALRSRGDYIEEVIEKVKRAHKKLPAGGILVFLTGKNEILEVQKRLRSEFARSTGQSAIDHKQTRVRFVAGETPLEAEDLDFGIVDDQRDDADHEIDILTHSDEEAEEREFEISDDEEEVPDQSNLNIIKISKKDPYDSVHILPLYSQLPTQEQLRVFEPPPDRSRLIVLATNVAETSLTIPGIRYVFDTGRSKERKYDLDTGVQRFEIDYISKASAQQRAGRAGRTGPGHCWRLYTSALFEQYFPDHTEPEILRAPAESVVLQIKGIGYPKPVSEFSFPTAPTLQSLVKAEKLLINLGALTPIGKFTELGKQLSNYPLSPRLGKILARAVSTEVLSQAIALVAGLSVSEIFVNDPQLEIVNQEDDDDERDARKQQFGRVRATLSRHDKISDAMKMLTAVATYMEGSDKAEICRQYFLRPKAMAEISQLIHQLRGIVQSIHPTALLQPLKDAKKISSPHIKQINSAAASGYVDQVAIRWDLAPVPPTLPNKPRRSIDVPYIPLEPLLTSTSSGSDPVESLIFIHPSSLLARVSLASLPQYITYTHLQRSQAHTITAPSTKTRMFPLTALDGNTLKQLAASSSSLEIDGPKGSTSSSLLHYGKPLPKMPIEEGARSPSGGRQRICWVSTELRSEGMARRGMIGWPLPPSKVRQVVDLKSKDGWRVEEVLQ